MGGSDGAVALAASLKERAGFRENPDDLVPVASALRELLPAAGLRRGSTMSVADAAGGTSLLIALVTEASRAGGWCAAVGMPELSAVSAAEMGVALDRLAVVPRPGRSWPTVVAALLEGIDVVIVRPPPRPASREVRRLTARARERGAVLISAGPWEGAELRLAVTATRWQGVGAGHGHLRARELRVRVEGRGAAARPRETTLWLPAPETGPVSVRPRATHASQRGAPSTASTRRAGGEASERTPWPEAHGLTDTGASPVGIMRVAAA